MVDPKLAVITGAINPITVPAAAPARPPEVASFCIFPRKASNRPISSDTIE